MNETYLAYERNSGIGLATWKEFEETETRAPMETTVALLMQILQDNKDTEYGQKYGFGDIHTVEEYQMRVPVVVYDDIAPEIERMAKGEKNVLTAYPFTHFNETSGTVGVPKLIPMSDRQADVFGKYNNLLLYGIMRDKLDPDWMNGRAFCTSSGTFRTLESGLTVGCASSKMAEKLRGGMNELDSMLRTLYTSPVEAMTAAPHTDAKYIHARFALMDRNVRGIVTGFYSVLVLFLRYIADHYALLIDDIEKGTISPEIEMPDDVRESLLKKIEPMPERARELREIFKNGSDFPFVRKIWPNFCYFSGVGGDGFEIYDKMLKEHFTDGNVSNIYSGVTSSEGLWSVPSGVDSFDSILAPASAFIEFLPVEAGSDFSQCVTMDRLEVGKTYELIITNLSGFYRYRMSDAVKVTGFFNKTPTVQFMYRVNRTINLAAEKTTEKALQLAVEATAEEMGFTLADFSVYPNTDVNPNRYDFLIEPMKEITRFDMRALTQCLFRHLCEANPVYHECYEDKELGMPAVYFLQPETSLLYRDMMVYRGASLNQLKPVRVIANERQRKFFYMLRQEVEDISAEP